MDEYSPGAGGQWAGGKGAEQDGGGECGEDEFSAIVPRIFMLADSIERGGSRSRIPDVQ